jgi:tetratricopeptide (TPR) repeat protein
VTPAQQARTAAQHGEFASALELLERADLDGALGFDDLVLKAEVAYAVGELATTIESFERAHALAVAAGDRANAAVAAARTAMHLLMDTGLMAAVRAWARRAELHIDGTTVPMPAWLGVARAYERLLSGDFAAARAWGQRAVDAAETSGETAPLAMGRLVQARSLIFEGDLSAGLELLDEAAAYALSGEVEALPVGLIYCELICAWQALAHFDRAEEYTAAMERWCQQHAALGSVHGRCRVHRAELLRLRGSCADAEKEALLACDELSPILAREFGWPLTELGQIRLQAGDLDGAEDAFLQAHQAGWEPQPGLALLHLERGDLPGAVTSIEAALDRPLDIPSKELPPNTELRRAPLLAAQVQICVAAGDLEVARRSAEELGAIAARFSSPGLAAQADHAQGTVELAAGDAGAAVRSFDRAVGAWIDMNVPYEGAMARVGSARARRATGDHHGATMELRAAAATFRRVGAVTRADATLAEADDPDGSRVVDRPSGAATAGVAPIALTGEAAFVREGDHWTVVFAGETVRVRDLKGMAYLARLVARPGSEIHALDLVASHRPGEPAGSVARAHPDEVEMTVEGDLGAALDATAKRQYRQRLLEIEEDVAEAEALGDEGRAARAAVDREFLVRELSRAVGLGGRDRRMGSSAERARVSATRAIRLALERIGEQHSTLAAHLDHAIHTGTYCRYEPDPRLPVDWRT